MKAIILAAGEGRRLHPITEEIPKALLYVDGRTLFEKALHGLRLNGIKGKDLIVLTGHKAKELHKVAPDCLFIHNDLYDKTNNIYSLWLANEELRDNDFILLNCDVLFHPKLLDALFSESNPGKSSLLIDDVHELAEEEMKVMLGENKRIIAISKKLDPKTCAGEYIGLARFCREFSRCLFAKIEEMITEGRKDVWYEDAISEILDETPIYSLSTNGLPWIEIDTHEDLDCAQQVAREIERTL
jgi:choline kinase